MRALVVIAVLLGVAYAAPKRLASLQPATGEVIQDEYIVVFSERATDKLVDSHHQKLAATLAQYNSTQLRVMHQYHIGSFRGYSANLNDKALEMVREDLIVKYIEHNQVVTAYQGRGCDEQSDAPWGVARTSSTTATDDGFPYYYSDAAMGEGVNAYIIDTGIYLEHNEFEGRAIFGYDAVKEGSETDLNGHGTHVAGTVTGKNYGIAKKATAIAVKVLGAFGSGSTAGVIDGIDWAANDHDSSERKKSVANMSLGGSRSTAMNAAVEAAADEKGLAFSIAAGNSNDDACSYSPASADVMAVAASDSSDTKSSFSSYGSCVGIIAPGEDVLSAWIGGEDATRTISGTSMAAPHVAGVMAKILSSNADPMTPTQLEDKVLEKAMQGAITGFPTSQDNKFLHWPCPQDS